jgi:hypothetical protein
MVRVVERRGCWLINVAKNGNELRGLLVGEDDFVFERIGEVGFIASAWWWICGRE